MEFHEKLQELRKKRGLTQEELAQVLYVSRAAVSKWESGRGYPNIDSLKAIARYFSVTVDELLSGGEMLSIAEEDGKEKQQHVREIVFGLLDCAAAALLFLPFFGQRGETGVRSVSLLALHGVQPWLRGGYLILVAAMVAVGVLTLALQNRGKGLWRIRGSVLLNGVGVLLFVVSLQPYAAVFLLLFLAIKVFLLRK